MKKRMLGGTGLRISPISFGGITVANLEDDVAVELVNEAIDGGMNYFDTAHSYSDTSATLGRILPDRREEIYVGAKVLDRSEDEAYRRLRSSLQDLRMDSTDIMWLHAVDDEEILDQVLGEGGAVHAISRCRDEGLTRFLGITGHRPDILARAVMLYPFDVVMAPINYVYRFSFNAEGGLLPLCRKRGIGVMAIKPRAHGRIGDMELAYRYVLAQGVTTVIPHRTPEEMWKALSIINELDEMPQEEVNRLLDSAPELEGRCRQCSYCLPCPEGLDIPRIIKLEDIWHGPHRREEFSSSYKSQVWARRLYSELKVGGDACTGCGICEERCPHGVSVMDKMAASHSILTQSEQAQ
jgi:predicted aldo/keto reductase-like oxidoreductase